MNMHSTTPSSGRNLAAGSAPNQSGAPAYMSERQLQAYLLARDTVRRVQRTASLMAAIPRCATGNRNRAQHGSRPRH